MIEVRDLHKHFEVHKRPPGLAAAMRSLVRRTTTTVKAVDGVSFTVAAGERVGFLGPNGAGKTTTLKVLSGLLHPTSGEARVGGRLPYRRERDHLRAITLVMGQKQQLLWDLPPAETFAMNRAIFDVPPAQFKKTLDELTALLELGDLIHKPTRQLSLGERMKCELVAALLHQPGVLFLDEPTIGLDVSMQVAIREFIREYNQRHQATIVLTSHYMDDVVALCLCIIVIDHGRLIHDGDLRALIKTMDPDKRVSFRLRADAGSEAGGRAATADELGRLGTVLERDGERVVLRVAERELADAIGHLLGQHRVEDLSIEDPPLEDVLRQLFDRHKVPASAVSTAPAAATTP